MSRVRVLLAVCCIVSCLATPRPVIISTDPGIDDSIALLLAASSPEIELKAVCVNFGSLKNMTQLAGNALSVLALAGASEVPVYMGADAPLNRDNFNLGGELFHGHNGLGGVPQPSTPSHGVNLTLSAAEYIVHACRTWEPAPALISLSPLANIALALELEPNLPKLCPDLYLMGGTVFEAGNVSPVAEANIANDADAAKAVFSAGFNAYVAGLDVTMSVWLNNTYLERYRDLGHPVGDFIWNITRFYTNAYKVHAAYPGGVMPVHDPSAVMMLLAPELFGELRRWNTTVDTAAYPGVTRGMMIPDRRAGPSSPPSTANSYFAMALDEQGAEGYREQLYNRIASLKPTTATN